ncbi:MAG: hypothetical protein ACRC54_04235 [Fusobacteriaceae bacterium]
MRERKIVVKILTIVAMAFIFSSEILASTENIKIASATSNIGIATVTTNLEMFTTIGNISGSSTSGTLRDITLMKISHSSNSYGDGVTYMNTRYKLQDSLNGDYRINNIKTRISNSSKASINIKNQGKDEIYVSIDEYLADDINKDAVIEIIGDITYSSLPTISGLGTITAISAVEPLQQSPLVQTVSLPIAINEYITLSVKPLNMGTILRDTGIYEKETDIDITGGKNTEVVIKGNGVEGSEIYSFLLKGTEKIPITYRIEDGNKKIIKNMKLDSNGAGKAILRGIIDSNSLPTDVDSAGAYNGSVTIEVDYL